MIWVGWIGVLALHLRGQWRFLFDQVLPLILKSERCCKKDSQELLLNEEKLAKLTPLQLAMVLNAIAR